MRNVAGKWASKQLEVRSVLPRREERGTIKTLDPVLEAKKRPPERV